MTKHKDRNKNHGHHAGTGGPPQNPPQPHHETASQLRAAPSSEAIAELRTIIETEMARQESKKAAKLAAVQNTASLLQTPPEHHAPDISVLPFTPPPPASIAKPVEKAPTPSPSQPTMADHPMNQAQATPSSAPSSEDKAAKTAAAPVLPTPDFSGLSSKIMQIAARSQKLVNAFLDRNRTMIGKMPAIDPGHIGKAFTDFTAKVLSDPNKLVETQIAFWQDYVKLLKGAFEAQAGQKPTPVIQADPSDKRFKDPAWQEVWVFDFIKQSYLLMSRLSQTLLKDMDGMDPKIAHKVEFYTHQMVDAMSPTNFWMTNPEVLRTTIETRGENLVHGLENLLADIERGHGQLQISMSDNSVFKFGENIATSKGKVVYQNELMQLIQFSPLTEKVHRTPFLITPPWINKYYILDLKAENSFIRYLVESGHTVYCISWVNPDSRHANMSFDDYMMLGPVAASKEIAKITGEKKLNCLGYCIGGTLVSCMMGWLEALGDKKPADMPEISSATYLVTLIDFEEPGDIGVFIDEEQIEMIEGMMKDKGYLSAGLMGTTFAMLRANDLVWSFVVNNYLMGREPFPFDLLTWNSDSTNLPYAMHSYYLRNMYLNNKLIKPNGLSMKGTPINLHKVKVPTFCLSTQEDHITPWRSTYAATQTYAGPVTFCLSGSGHIAGVVNPPAKKKYGYWTNDVKQCPANPDEWLKGATKHEGSWWPEWIKWLDGYSGEMVPARDPAANANVIEDAPGSYVRVRVL